MEKQATTRKSIQTVAGTVEVQTKYKAVLG